MAQRIDVPGKGILEFPDGMTHEEMSAAIYKNFPDLKTEEPKKESGGMGGFLGRAIGAAGLLTGTPNKQAAQLGESAARGAAQPFVDVATGVNKGLEAAGLEYPGGVQGLDLIKNAPDKGTAEAAGLASSFALPMLKPLQLAGKAGKAAKLGDLAFTGAAYGGADALAKDQNAGPGALLGAALPIGLHGVTAGAMQIPNAIGKGLSNTILKGVEKASKREGSGTLSPEEIAKRLPAYEGVPIPLHEATNAGVLRTVANEMGEAPFSGIQNPAQTAVKKTDELAQGLYNSIGGHVSYPEATPMIRQALQKSYQDVKTKSSENYNKLIDSAKDAGVTGNINNLQKFSKEIYDDYASQAEKNVPHWLDSYPMTRELVKNFSKGFIPSMENEFVVKEGKSVNDLRDLLSAQQAVGRKMANAKEGENKGLLKQLYNLSQKDLEDAITATERPDLIKNLAEAKSFHKENVIPYREGKLANIVSGKEADRVATMLAKNKYSKVIDHLPPEVRGLILSQALNKAAKANPTSEDQLITNSTNLLREYGKFKKDYPQIFDKLLTPEIQQTFEKLQNLHEATKGLRHIATPAPTGKQVKKLLIAGTALSAGALSPLTTVGALLGNRKFQTLLRNPKMIEAYAAGSTPERKNILSKIFNESKTSKAVNQAGKVLNNPGFLSSLLTGGPGGQLNG